MLQDVKQIIAIASGKGGVGKSTVTANLALALAAKGKNVGILDADIYGPSQARMFDLEHHPLLEADAEQRFQPLTAKGIELMSIAFLVDQTTPMIWRGPMASGALQQLLNQTRWSPLDYLLIDMPPGTGDIALTLAQKTRLTGAIIVTTPQDIALLDARRGIEMFQRVKVPVLGVIENMSLHTCSQCGHTEAIFGAGGGQQLAQDYAVSLLGQLPLALSIRQQADQGNPSVASDPQGDVAQRFAEIAQAILQLQTKESRPQGPQLSFGKN